MTRCGLADGTTGIDAACWRVCAVWALMGALEVRLRQEALLSIFDGMEMRLTPVLARRCQAVRRCAVWRVALRLAAYTSVPLFFTIVGHALANAYETVTLFDPNAAATHRPPWR